MAFVASSPLPMGDPLPASKVLPVLFKPYWARYPAQRPAPRQKLAMTGALQTQLTAINAEVNRSIEYKLDGGRYGPDVATLLPNGGSGDCEDYAVTKRYLASQRHGIPYGGLMLALCDLAFNPTTAHIAVLVHTTAGDYIMDNFIEEIVPWTATPYLIVCLAEAGSWRATRATQQILDAPKDQQRALAGKLTLAARNRGQATFSQYLSKIAGVDRDGRLIRVH